MQGELWDVFKNLIELCFRYLDGRVDYCKVSFIDGTFVADKLEGPGKVCFVQMLLRLFIFCYLIRLSVITRMFWSAILFKELFMDLQNYLILTRN